MKKVKIYTDGACRGNPGIGGWGVLMCYQNKEKVFWGAERDTTNNRMELTAALKALEILKESCEVEIYTDSQYVQKGITLWIHNWKKRSWKKSNNSPVKNSDLWQKLESEALKHDLNWHWVRGHSGHVGNERADALANKAIDSLLDGGS